MEKFEFMLQAAMHAVNICKKWSFVDSSENYDAQELLDLAKENDNQYLVDEGDFYVVSDTGAIGLCMDGGRIDWMIIPEKTQVKDLPPRYQAASQNSFCPHCGAAVRPDSRFCSKCGGKLK